MRFFCAEKKTISRTIHNSTLLTRHHLSCHVVSMKQDVMCRACSNMVNKEVMMTCTSWVFFASPGIFLKTEHVQCEYETI